jgi:molecular chaperone IbpA
MTALTTFDTTALNNLNRALIGFDRVFSERALANNNYPPYNIVKKGDDLYEIQVAVAGFTLTEIDIEVNQDQLVVTGSASRTDVDYEYLHRGIGLRDFTRAWTLAEYVHVQSAKLENGLLLISLKREVPESKLPKKIFIES